MKGLHGATGMTVGKRKRVLIIAYHYPPSEEGNPYPTDSWVRYLPEMGWDPFVLTCLKSPHEKKDGGTSSIYFIRDDQSFKALVRLRSKLPTNGLAFKLLNFLIINFLHYPDERRGWIKNAIRKGEEIVKESCPDLILSIATPWTDHLISSRISKRTCVPWIADYMDPWTQRISHRYRFKWIIHNGISRLLEKHITKTAKCCIHASAPWASQLSHMLKKQVYSISNGFDPQDFENTAGFTPDNKIFIISYVGSMHFPQKPQIFLSGFQRFLECPAVSTENCKLQFIGTSEIAGLINDYPLIKKYTVITGYLSKPEAIRRMCESHILLLFLNEDDGWYPTKAFEYLASGRTILASPDNGGVINELLNSANAGIVLNSPDAVSEWLEVKFKEFQFNGSLERTRNPEVVARFDRRKLTATLATILDSITGGL